MPVTDVFAYGDSGLGRFLFAEIGIEQNGSALTVLSALARNGDDPWEKAAQWAKAPRAKVVDWLAADITRLPMTTEAVDSAHDIAERLVQLLPSPGRLESKAIKIGQATLPRWGSAMLLAASIVVAVAAAVALSLHPNSLVGYWANTSPSTPTIAAGQ